MKFIQILVFCLTIQVIHAQTIIPVPDKKLTQAAIENKSIHELWLMRNSIFAKHGRPFKTYELHAIFMKQSWYKPNPEYDKSMLSANDVHNVDFILEQEKQLRQQDYVYMRNMKTLNYDNIYNIFQYAGFSTVEKQLIGQNGFVVLPTQQDQLFYIYENNDYLGIPSFITTDAVLQLYHLFFDKTLRTIESDFLSAKLKTLLTQLVIELNTLKTKSDNKHILEAIDFNLAYLTVPLYFLDKSDFRVAGKMKEIAEQEIENCENHEGWLTSSLFNRMMDYSQYIPRGHYTRSKVLENYFMAMMWLGNAGIEVEKKSNALSSALITYLLYEKNHDGEPLIELWKDIYEPTVFYVGLSDDTGPVEFKRELDISFPVIDNIEILDNTEKLKEIMARLPDEKISGHGEWGSQKKQFRLMGQRFIPDSYVFDRLTSDVRKKPMSLEVMAAFGNEEAYLMMMNDFASSWKSMPDYPEKMKALLNENKQLTKEDWTQNLYYHWLYNLKALYEIKDKSALPFFMTTNGWKVKTLNTALASWSELRHNTILYAKQSVAAECGGGEEEGPTVWIPEPPKGYVEPNVEFYQRMLSLMNMTKNGLEERKMLDGRLKYLGDEFIDLISFLEKIAAKEINGEKISLEEYEQIQKLGSLLNYMTLSVLADDYEDWWQLEGPDKNMPVIADVHTADFEALEVGVGKAHEIYVAVEIEGKIKLTRGAIFSFYEFYHPISDRLTDEKWQEMLNTGKAPEQPSWINYKSDQKSGKNLSPLYKPDNQYIPDSSTEPGWTIIYYDTGC